MDIEIVGAARVATDKTSIVDFVKDDFCRSAEEDKMRNEAQDNENEREDHCSSIPLEYCVENITDSVEDRGGEIAIACPEAYRRT